MARTYLCMYVRVYDASRILLTNVSRLFLSFFFPLSARVIVMSLLLLLLLLSLSHLLLFPISCSSLLFSMDDTTR